MKSSASALDFPVTLVVAGLATMATLIAIATDVGDQAAPWLVADSARIRAGELWRLLTGPFVHATAGHLLRDLAVCAIVGVAYEAALRRCFPALTATTLVLPTLAVVVVDVELGGYYGLSGMSHGLIAAAITYELMTRRRDRYLVKLAGVALIVKLTYELATGAAMFPMALGDGVREVPVAHSTGALAGAAIVLWHLSGHSPKPDPCA